MIERRLLPVVAAVTALLVVVALAAHGRPLSGRPAIAPDATFFDFVATTLIICAAATVVFAVFRRHALGSAGLLLLALVAAFLAYVVTHENFRGSAPAIPCPTCPAGTVVHATRSHAKHVRPAHVQWGELALALVLVGGVALYLYAKRERPIEVPPRTRALRVVSLALDDLRSDPDVRRAIIAAYARMEHAFEAEGLPRRPSEAPFEYLERSLVELDAGGDAARRLTELFERAKFSDHELGEPMRDQAIDALVAVREDLRA